MEISTALILHLKIQHNLPLYAPVYTAADSERTATWDLWNNKELPRVLFKDSILIMGYTLPSQHRSKTGRRAAPKHNPPWKSHMWTQEVALYMGSCLIQSHIIGPSGTVLSILFSSGYPGSGQLLFLILKNRCLKWTRDLLRSAMTDPAKCKKA